MPCDYPQGTFALLKMPCDYPQGTFALMKTPCDYPQGTFALLKMPCDYPQGIFVLSNAIFTRVEALGDYRGRLERLSGGTSKRSNVRNRGCRSALRVSTRLYL